MKRLLAASLALALSACAGLTDAPRFAPPATIADSTTADEKGGLAITIAYNAANRLGLLAIRSGVARGATAEQIKLVDAKAFGWVQRARQAYLAGNADGFAAAEREAKRLITDLTNLAS